MTTVPSLSVVTKLKHADCRETIDDSQLPVPSALKTRRSVMPLRAPDHVPTRSVGTLPGGASPEREVPPDFGALDARQASSSAPQLSFVHAPSVQLSFSMHAANAPTSAFASSVPFSAHASAHAASESGQSTMHCRICKQETPGGGAPA